MGRKTKRKASLSNDGFRDIPDWHTRGFGGGQVYSRIKTGQRHKSSAAQAVQRAEASKKLRFWLREQCRSLLFRAGRRKCGLRFGAASAADASTAAYGNAGHPGMKVAEGGTNGFEVWPMTQLLFF